MYSCSLFVRVEVKKNINKTHQHLGLSFLSISQEQQACVPVLCPCHKDQPSVWREDQFLMCSHSVLSFIKAKANKLLELQGTGMMHSPVHM